MKTIEEYLYQSKRISASAGPWHKEPDKKQWQDPETGLACLIVRNEWNGNWCGYVGVPEGHHFFGSKYSEYENPTLAKIEVHGGLTFSDHCGGHICHKREPGDPEVWWFGFDCNHSQDRGAWPVRGFEMPGQVYRDQRYVEAQVTSLARQLA